MSPARPSQRASAGDRIELVSAPLESVPAEGVVRPVRSDGGPLTAVSRLLEIGAGQDVLRRVEAAGELPVGGAVLTPGGELATPFIIHAALQSPTEPVSRVGVRRALVNVLRRAAEWELDSIALPPLGIGAGNLDAEDAAAEMLPVLLDHLASDAPPRRVVLVVAAGYEEEAFRRVLASVSSARPPTGSGPPAGNGAVGG